MKMKRCLLLGGLMAGAALSANARNNVILFIADGMGSNHVKAARAYVNGDTSTLLNFEKIGDKGFVITKKPDGSPTDSATAATAMATGYQHPVDGVISMGYNYEVKQTILEWAQAKSLWAGIVTTDDIGGATPAAFGAHEPDRAKMDLIRADYLRGNTTYGYAATKPRILMGGGFNDPALLAGSSSTYVQLAQSLGYVVATSASDLQNDTTVKPILGLFGSSWAPMTAMLDRTAASSQPTLSQMVSKAIQRLDSGNPFGFLLVVESANIDKLSHANNTEFVGEIKELDNAVQVAMNWAAANQGDYNVVLVTADHETGGLIVPDQTVDAGTIPAMTWGSGSHTAADVPFYFFYNAGGRINGATLDNTEIFFLAQDGLDAQRGFVPPVITGLTVSGATGDNVTVQWNTTEPSSSVVTLQAGGNTVGEFSVSGRSTAHTVVCTGLKPGTTYSVIASSTDLFGAAATGTASFMTAGGDPNAYAVSSQVGPGTITGTLDGLRVVNDGKTQVVTESTDGAGLGITVEYTLQSTIAGKDMDSLTINAKPTWTGLDGTADSLLTFIRVLGPNGAAYWQPVSSFPFVASPPSSYADDQGKIIIHFEDKASIKRERQDKLTVDMLYGAVVANTTAPSMPTGANDTSAQASTGPLAVNLTWTDCTGETGYQIWKQTGGAWGLLTTLPANATSFKDTAVASSTTYSYVVRSFNADGYYDGTVVQVTTPLVLNAPTGVKAAIVKGTTGIAVTWADTNTRETSYEVLRGTAPGNYTVSKVLPANTVKYVDTSYSKGFTYYYTVRALNGTEPGVMSTAASIQIR